MAKHTQLCRICPTLLFTLSLLTPYPKHTFPCVASSLGFSRTSLSTAPCFLVPNETQKFHFHEQAPVTPSGIWQLHCTTPHSTSQPLQPPILQEQLPVSSHTPVFPVLLFLTCCTCPIHLLFVCNTFLRGCFFFCIALSLAQLLVLPTLWEEKPKCPTALWATSPPRAPPSPATSLVELYFMDPGLVFHSKGYFFTPFKGQKCFLN